MSVVLLVKIEFFKVAGERNKYKGSIRKSMTLEFDENGRVKIPTGIEEENRWCYPKENQRTHS